MLERANRCNIILCNSAVRFKSQNKIDNQYPNDYYAEKEGFTLWHRSITLFALPMKRKARLRHQHCKGTDFFKIESNLLSAGEKCATSDYAIYTQLSSYLSTRRIVMEATIADPVTISPSFLNQRQQICLASIRKSRTVVSTQRPSRCLLNSILISPSK